MDELRGLWRGKRIDNGEWIHGVPLQHCDGDWQLISGKVGAMVIQTVVADTLGECTGLRGKNGKPIFEGDIVEHNGERYVIKYLEKYMRFSPVKPGTVFAVFDYTQSENIGNIHDDPELLKGAKNENN